MIDNGKGSEFSTAYDGSKNPSKFDYTIQGLESQTTYQIKGYAVNKAGNGVFSTITTCYTATIPGQPGIPVLISSTPTQISLRWDPAYDDGGSPIKDYQLYLD